MEALAATPEPEITIFLLAFNSWGKDLWGHISEAVNTASIKTKAETLKKLVAVKTEVQKADSQTSRAWILSDLKVWLKRSDEAMSKTITQAERDFGNEWLDEGGHLLGISGQITRARSPNGDKNYSTLLGRVESAVKRRQFVKKYGDGAKFKLLAA